tara:strand:+ start:10746 stop:12056 length:1311 start_codon:yes stop_codon:yes gene_type:complete
MINCEQIQDPSSELMNMAIKVRREATFLSQSSDTDRKEALNLMADCLTDHAKEIVEANARDLENSNKKGISKALQSRLKFDDNKLSSAVEGIRKVSLLPDPIGLVQINRELSKELNLIRSTVPLGVIGVIFEARPDALIQIASLAIRSGNAAILKGGSEAINTNEITMKYLKEGLEKSNIKSQNLSLLKSRQESLSLLKLDGLVDLIIPRGSNQLVKYIQDNTRIPVLGHADGICHLFIDTAAQIDMAVNITIDSKMQYPAACNAVETLLIHKDIALSFLSKLIPIFDQLGVEIVGDKRSQKFGIKKNASDIDWGTEYLDQKISVKIVDDLDEALEHIRKYGSRHTDGIITDNNLAADKFLGSVDSAGVYHNCSTRFADGFRYGFGAEVGISTQTLPPRGPVGLEGLVTYKYILRGDGHIVSKFESGELEFSHRDL